MILSTPKQASLLSIPSANQQLKTIHMVKLQTCYPGYACFKHMDDPPKKKVGWACKFQTNV